MFLSTPLVQRLQVQAINEDLANRVIPADPPSPRSLTCPGCYRNRSELPSRGHGPGCYFNQRATRGDDR